MPKKPKKIELPPELGETAFEVAPTAPVEVAQTNRLYRLTPIADNLAEPHRQIALVATDSEALARRWALDHDPFGRDWLNETKFSCDFIDTPETHVVGDVIFKSMPAPPLLRAKRPH